MTEQKKPIDANTELAQHRTELALERTQLAWVRTAFTFITAAVAIERTVALESFSDLPAAESWRTAAINTSLALCVLTTILLAVASFQYVRQHRRVSSVTGIRTSSYWPSMLFAVVVVAFGVVASAMMIWTR